MYIASHVQSVAIIMRDDWKLVKGGRYNNTSQGSALGPLLFLIYVNNMPEQGQHGPLLQFADDTCLICCGSSSESVTSLGSIIES